MKKPAKHQKAPGFLRQHGEKLVLALCLGGFLIACGAMQRMLRAADKDISSFNEQLTRAIREERAMPILERASLRPMPIYDRGVVWVEPAEEDGLTMFDPDEYALCSNPVCAMLVPAAAESCPHCDIALRKALTPEEMLARARADSDRDGIPDEIEAKHSFLNEQDPSDALADADADGFTNLEEYRAQTAMDDESAQPSLLTKLRFLRSERRALGLTFVKLVRNDPRDPRTWDIQFEAVEDGRRVTRFRRLHQTLNGYVIARVLPSTKRVFDPQLNAHIVVDESEVELQRNGAEPIRLQAGVPAMEPQATVHFVFLSDLTNLQKCTKYELKEDEVLTLRGVDGRTESFRIQRVLSDRALLVRTDVPDRTETVQRFWPRRDLPLVRRAAFRPTTG